MIRVQIMVKTTIGNRYDFLRDDSSCRMNFLGRTACFIHFRVRDLLKRSVDSCHRLNITSIDDNSAAYFTDTIPLVIFPIIVIFMF